MNIFKRQTPEEAMRESKRDIRKGQRDMERDIREMERQEKQLIIEIKALAKKGDNASAKIMTKQLLNVRKQKEKLLMSKGAPPPAIFIIFFIISASPAATRICLGEGESSAVQC
jgi:hypothetical protein